MCAITTQLCEIFHIFLLHKKAYNNVMKWVGSLLFKLSTVTVSTLLLFSSSFFLSVHAASSTIDQDNLNDTVDKILFAEIKLGGTSYSRGSNNDKDPQEYILLYNSTDEEIDITNWRIEYAKPTFPKQYCDVADWSTVASSSVVSITPLAGSLLPNSFSSPIQRSLTDNAGGSLRLTSNDTENNQTIIHDLVGWGADAPCSYEQPAATPSNSQSLKRFQACSSGLYNSSNNSQDYISNQPPSPYMFNAPLHQSCNSDEEDDNNQQPDPDITVSCEGIIISEVLPNPAGSDTGREFIELHNPTMDFINLIGCTLQLSGSSKKFTFSNIELGPGSYRAFYDSQTGIVLPNAAEGTIYLVSHRNEEISATTYPPNMSDDVAWAWFAGKWESTYTPTPGAKNISQPIKPCPVGQVRNIETNRCASIVAAQSSGLADCGPGRERNPDTNRCRLISLAGGTNLKPCLPGQERNPETNRCRKIGSAGSQLVPCKPGQERNPETNRCRKIGGTTKSLVPCKPGQERNPETNRCRKVATLGANTTSSLSEVEDLDAAPTLSTTGWWIAGFSALFATGYGAWEWRRDIFAKFSKKSTSL
jgi:hypothetical protein